MMTDDDDQKCSWPGCTVTSAQPFADGWGNYMKAADLFPGLPEDGWLCPFHGKKFEELALQECGD
jgi:hypothetical protein